MRESHDQRKGEAVQGGHAPATETVEEPVAVGSFTSIGDIPKVSLGDLGQPTTASQRGFDDEPYVMPGMAHVEAGNDKQAKATHKAPTFKTVTGGQAEQTHGDEARLLNAIRALDQRLDPVWLMRAQTKLSVSDASGAMNTETLRALIDRKVQAGTARTDITAESLLELTFLNGIDPAPPFAVASKDWFHHEQKNDAARTDADKAAQAVGYADYADYEGEFLSSDEPETNGVQKEDGVRFLGVSLKQGKSDGRAHPYLVERLRVAEAYLHQRHGSDNKKVIKAIGWDESGGLAYETHGKDITGYKGKGPKDPDVDQKSHQHTMGLAIDISPGHNPWIYRNEWSDAEYDLHFRIASSIFGGSAITADAMVDWSRTMSTEELHAKITASSTAWTHYLDLGKKSEDEIQRQIEAHYEKDAAKAKELAGKVKRFTTWFSAGGGRENATGLTTINMDLLVALRDVAGLSWGGTEMGHTQNGDFMHFDCRNTTFGDAIMKKMSPAEQAEEKKKQAEKAAKAPRKK